MIFARIIAVFWRIFVIASVTSARLWGLFDDLSVFNKALRDSSIDFWCAMACFKCSLRVREKSIASSDHSRFAVGIWTLTFA